MPLATAGIAPARLAGAALLDRAGRTHVLHNDDVALRAIATIALDQYRTLWPSSVGLPR